MATDRANWKKEWRKGTAEEPNWGHSSRVHDWRNHVGENVLAIWDTFTLEQKRAIVADAEIEAGAEVWE